MIKTSKYGILCGSVIGIWLCSQNIFMHVDDLCTPKIRHLMYQSIKFVCMLFFGVHVLSLHQFLSFIYVDLFASFNIRSCACAQDIWISVEVFKILTAVFSCVLGAVELHQLWIRSSALLFLIEAWLHCQTGCLSLSIIYMFLYRTVCVYLIKL